MTFDDLVSEIKEQSNNPARILDCLFERIKAEQQDDVFKNPNKYICLGEYFDLMKRYIDVKLRLHRLKRVLSYECDTPLTTHRMTELGRLEKERIQLKKVKNDMKTKYFALFGEYVPSVAYPSSIQHQQSYKVI